MKKEGWGKKRIAFWAVILMLVFLCVPVAAEEYTAESFANLSEEEYIALATKMYWPTLEKYLKEARNNFTTWNIIRPEFGEGKTVTGYGDGITAEGVGYAFFDLAEDGVPELVFGLTDYDGEIHSIYGYENGKIKQIYGNGMYREGAHLTSDKKMSLTFYGSAVGGVITTLYEFIPDKAEMKKVMSVAELHEPEIYSYKVRIGNKEIEISKEQYNAFVLNYMNIDWLKLMDLKEPSSTNDAASSEFLLGESDARLVTEQDLEAISYLVRLLVKMEIYVHHGYSILRLCFSGVF